MISPSASVTGPLLPSARRIFAFRSDVMLGQVLVKLQLDLIERAVFTPGVLDSALAGIAATKDRDFARPAVVKQFLDPPISGVLAIPEYVGAKSSGVGPSFISVSGDMCSAVSTPNTVFRRQADRVSSPLINRLISGS
jgi:hypothetical protein